MQCGANISFLSCFPGEDEWLFPPNTYLVLTLIDQVPRPVYGPDGKIEKDGGSISQDGTILDADGKPVVGVDGMPVVVIKVEKTAEGKDIEVIEVAAYVP